MHDFTKSQTELSQELDSWHGSIHVKLNDGFALENTMIIDSVEYKRCLKRIFGIKKKRKKQKKLTLSNYAENPAKFIRRKITR